MARHQTSLALADRCERVRNRRLAVRGAGVPSTARVVTVHTCYQIPQQKPSFCSCAEKVTESTARELIETGAAEWVKSQRRSGAAYVWRRAIAFRKDVRRFPVDPSTGRIIYQGGRNRNLEILAAAFKAIDEQVTINKVAKDQSDAKKSSQRRIRATSAIDRTVDGVLAKLTAQEKSKTDPPAILHALQGATNLTTIAEALSAEPARQVKLLKILQAAQRQYWHSVLVGENLSVHRGALLDEAPKGRGRLAYLEGRTSQEVEAVAAHWEENEEGHHKATGANFVPGEGIFICSGDPMAYMGDASDDYETAQIYFENISHGKSSERPQAPAEEPDVFELADQEDELKTRFERDNITGLTFEKFQRLEKDCEESE